MVTPPSSGEGQKRPAQRPLTASRPVLSAKELTRATATKMRPPEDDDDEAFDEKPRRTAPAPAPKRKNSKGSGGGSFLPPGARRALIKFLLVCFLLGGTSVGLLVAYYAYDMPDIRQVAQPERAPSIQILADDGSLCARYGDLYGQHVTLADVSPDVVHAILAIEDRRFYSHFGVDLFGMLRAFIRNMIAGHVVQGGSTLTQQLAKNLFLTPDRTFKRKVQEMLLAFQLERTYSKDQILTAYLNRVYLGSGAYGVDGAAMTYFDKHARDLNLRESATIAGLLRAPSAFSPMNDPARSAERTAVVLNAMYDADFITKDQLDNALSEAPVPRRKPGAGGDGRYFGDWIVSQLNGLLQDVPQDVIVETTLNMDMQRSAERHLDAILSASGKGSNVAQGAIVTLAPDGAVKALVGGRDYDDSKFNRATQAKRQPGSSFKPIVYLAALEGGMSPNDTFEDAPLTIGDWSPENYEKKFLGQVTARTALAESINTVAVRVLQKIGVAKVIQTAKALGIDEKLDPNLSLALGTSVVTPLEMTGVYASLASGGRLIMPYAIKEIRNRNGDILYRRPDVRMPIVADPHAVAQLADMMTEVIHSGTGRKAALDRPVAGKTGTSSDYRDAWFMGFTGNLTTGVWLGNDDNTPMRKVTGGGLPAQLWHDYMADVESRLSPRPLLADAPQPAAPPQPEGGDPSGQATGTLPDNPTAPAEPEKDSLGDLIRDIIGKDGQ